MRGNFNKSLKFAKDNYNYKNPESPGSLPPGIIIDMKKYILIPVEHSAVCDNKCCQKQFLKFYIDEPTNKKYSKAPVYSNWGKNELCIICAGNLFLQNDFRYIKTFIPTDDEITSMLSILKIGDVEMSDESVNESDSIFDNEGDTDYSTSEQEMDYNMSCLTVK